MDGLLPKTSEHRGLQIRRFWRWMWVVVPLGLTVIAAAAAAAFATEHHNGFDDEKPTWNVRVANGELASSNRQRVKNGAFRGASAEAFTFQVQRGPTTLLLDHKLPVSRAIDDVKLSLMIRSNGGAVTAGMRVVFPRQIDPRNEQQLKCMLRGDSYSQAERWQRLQIVVSSKSLQEQQRLMRAKLKPAVLDLRDPVIDRVVLEVTLDAGVTELMIDEMDFGPIVAPESGPEIKAVNNTEEKTPWPVSFELDRLSISGRPFFPRMMPYHGESLDQLADAGFNIVWIPDAADIELQRALKLRGMWATAVPPRPLSASGDSLDDQRASLLPIPNEWNNILIWNMGVALPTDARQELLPWITQVQSADHERHRPIMADVLGGERIYSRHVSMLGSSRHILNSSLSLKSFREILEQRRKLARPGSFMFTWLPTEPLPEINRQRLAAGRIPMIVEHEQLRLLTYASLAAGCRGLGFSLSEPLDSKTPGADERRISIALLNQELELLEDFLAGGTLVEQRQFEINGPRSSNPALHTVSFSNSAISRAEKEAQQAARKSSLRREARLRSELEAAVFKSDKALLLLPIWYEQDAQFVPGQLTAPGATIDVSSVPDTASAWEVSTTRVANLPSEPIPGGRRIRLSRFDTTAAIVVTSDPSVVMNLRRKMETMQAASARHWIDLSKAKLNRVRIADDEITKLGFGLPDAPQLLARARDLIQRAETSFPADALERIKTQRRESAQTSTANSADVVQLRKRFDEATQLCQSALQTLRILQRAHWESAIQKLGSPVASPHTLCFQTLPDHWRLISNLGKSATRDSDNLLPHGDFEVLDFPTLTQFGWRQLPTTVQQGIRVQAQVLTATGRESRCLRLLAAPETNTDPPSVVESAPLSIAAPPIPVKAGQIIHVSGSVRVGSAVNGSLDGVTLTDNLTGLTGAMHWNEKRDWQKLELLREVYHDGDFTLTFTLHGLGDIQFDDLKVIAHDPPQTTTSTGAEVTPTDPVTKPGRFDFWQRLPKFQQRGK